MERFEPLFLKQRSADAVELEIGMTCAQSSHQAGTQDVTGTFSGKDADPERARHQRRMPFVEALTESIKS